jgi:hypothetical protein
MSGGGGRSYGRGGRGSAGRGKSRGRGHSYTGTSVASKKGLCEAVGINVFDYGQKAAADQMQTSWEKITEYVGTTHGQESVLRLLIILRTVRYHTYSRPSRRFTNIISIAAFASLLCMLMESSLL